MSRKRVCAKILNGVFQDKTCESPIPQATRPTELQLNGSWEVSIQQVLLLVGNDLLLGRHN